MNVAIGIASRVGPKDNPLLKRCIESITSTDPGIPFEMRIETGGPFTRGEKRQRIFNWAKQNNVQFVCILEDDTEMIQPGWLLSLVIPCISEPMVGMVNPLESRNGTYPGGAPNVQNIVREAVTMFGFCILYNMVWDPVYDPMVTHLDDLGMALLCRSKGYRLAITGHTTVRHSKEPFFSDEIAPWDQEDRERWGDQSVYYQKDKHFEARLIESQHLIARFGDMATTTLPSELVEELRRRVAGIGEGKSEVVTLKEPG